MTDIFHNPATKLPKKPDSQTVRVPMDQDDISGRKSHMPDGGRSEDMSIKHVPNVGGND